MTLSGMLLILVRLVQSLKAHSSILVRLSGKIMLVKLVQFEKAHLPILVRLSGKSMLVKSMHL